MWCQKLTEYLKSALKSTLGTPCNMLDEQHLLTSVINAYLADSRDKL